MKTKVEQYNEFIMQVMNSAIDVVNNQVVFECTSHQLCYKCKMYCDGCLVSQFIDTAMKATSQMVIPVDKIPINK